MLFLMAIPDPLFNTLSSISSRLVLYENFNTGIGMTRVSLYTSIPLIRRHAPDIYLGMCPVQNGDSYLNVLAHLGETSRTVAKKNS